jgi:diaminohydroxyphosphoribosylaminopyrimidine deaminase/5-amino-6-(5-phosphoribosylamino)uracil reductase
MASDAEQAAMRRAIELSRAALGTTNPNPAVGAVVLDTTGQQVGEGVTQPVGGDHAEVVALRNAGTAAAGGTLVVTLEPCGHVGRTRPCTDVVTAAGISRVVFAVADPHDLAAGGADRLRATNVDVEAGVLADDAATVLGPWVTAMARKRPFVTWKYAATLDGRTAAADGSSRWITGADARRDVHRERLLADAVVVGIGTVLADDPQLTVRDCPAPRQPLRVVVDTDARTPLGAKVLDRAAHTAIAVADNADDRRIGALRDAGADVIRLPRAHGGTDLSALLSALLQREAVLAFVEGGATLATSFVKAGLVDRVLGYQAPMLLGCGTPLLGDVGATTLTAATRLAVDEVGTIGDDIRIVARITGGA